MGHTMISQRVIYKSSLISKILCLDESKGIIFCLQAFLEGVFFFGFIHLLLVFFCSDRYIIGCYQQIISSCHKICAEAFWERKIMHLIKCTKTVWSRSKESKPRMICFKSRLGVKSMIASMKKYMNKKSIFRSIVSYSERNWIA